MECEISENPYECNIPPKVYIEFGIHIHIHIYLCFPLFISSLILANIVTYLVDGRKLDFQNAAFVPCWHIMSACVYKKEKIKHYYRQLEQEFDDSDDDEFNEPPPKKKSKKGAGVGGKK